MHRVMYNAVFCDTCPEVLYTCTSALLECQAFCAPGYSLYNVVCSQVVECVLASAAAPILNKNLSQDSHE